MWRETELFIQEDPLLSTSQLFSLATDASALSWPITTGRCRDKSTANDKGTLLIMEYIVT
jgi:hypothetical protein